MWKLSSPLHHIHHLLVHFLVCVLVFLCAESLHGVLVRICAVFGVAGVVCVLVCRIITWCFGDFLVQYLYLVLFCVVLCVLCFGGFLVCICAVFGVLVHSCAVFGVLVDSWCIFLLYLVCLVFWCIHVLCLVLFCVFGVLV